MEFKFKKQAYQTVAVNNTADVFLGQTNTSDYQSKNTGPVFDANGQQDLFDLAICANHKVDLAGKSGPYNLSELLLANINAVQQRSNIILSSTLSSGKEYGCCALDIEMETGTGKTYVYINTIFELNKRYGWTKFVVVVPSIAIREGALKSFKMLERHFFDEYGKKAHYFVYNSDRLADLKQYAYSENIEVMIINTQAFNSLDESKKSARIIYSHRDEFGSYRPIDAIAHSRPIIIIDEPQKAAGKATQNALKEFKPLFTLNYSATHKTKHNCIYALDAIDAFAHKLVKRISVKGLELVDITSSNGYLYLDEIVISKDDPQAVIELEVKRASGKIVRTNKKLDVNDSLYEASCKLSQYKDLRITDIKPETNSVVLSNGTELIKGQVIGDTSKDTMERLQIRETIRSHFDKEEILFNHNIKTLSLFFIDEVANYRTYDDDGVAHGGKFAQYFEQEYESLLLERLSNIEEQYRNRAPQELSHNAYYQYLLKTKDNIASLHNGYFSIDKNHRFNNGKANKEGLSDDIAAYDLILRDKERLLSFDEPTRFIFSHSALREGWDNPNVFQICTLRHTDSEISKRQEIGRGLRLCVNQNGDRMDEQELGQSVHELNTLSVIANESYESFVANLQKETKETLRTRPTKVDIATFVDKTVTLEDKSNTTINHQQATSIYSYLYDHDYINDDGVVTDLFKQDLANNSLAEMSKKIAAFKDFMIEAAKATYAEATQYASMLSNEMRAANKPLHFTDNFSKTEFQTLWESINNKCFYTVDYDSQELITKAIKALNEQLLVAQMKVQITTSTQVSCTEFGDLKTTHDSNLVLEQSSIKYDPVGEIAQGAKLTRRTAAAILRGLTQEKFALFANNPESFIEQTTRIIREQKANMIVEHITYEPLSEKYSANIFVETKLKADKHYEPRKKHITNVVASDSKIENDFATELEEAQDVCVYAKLPRGFKIPTPVGDYSPDWAVVFHTGQVKHLYFVAETKGTMEKMQLRAIESAKIECAQKLYNVPSSKVKYAHAVTYKDLLDAAKGQIVGS